MKNTAKSLVCRSSAFVVAAGLPVAAAASYYDFFVQRSDTTVSMVALVAIIIGAVSFKDALLRYFKTPSALKIWIVVFVLAFVTSRIAEQFVVISAFGLAAQGVALPLNMLGDRYRKRHENENMREVLNGIEK